MEIGFAVCGSFCTYSIVFPVMEQLSREHHVTPIFSDAAYQAMTEALAGRQIQPILL